MKNSIKQQKRQQKILMLKYLPFSLHHWKLMLVCQRLVEVEIPKQKQQLHLVMKPFQTFQRKWFYLDKIKHIVSKAFVTVLRIRSREDLEKLKRFRKSKKKLSKQKMIQHTSFILIWKKV